MRKNLLVEIIGWYGAVAILLAYLLVSFKIVDGNSLTFQLLNLTGAFGIITISAYKNVKQSVVLNIFWATIAFVAIAKLFMH